MLVQIAKDRLFPSTKGVVGKWHWNRDIDPDHADINPVGEITRGIAIAGKDRSTIAVFMVNCQIDCFFIASGTYCAQNWSEDFLFIDVHIRCNTVKQMRSDKKPVFITLQSEIPAINDQLCALIYTTLNKAKDIAFGRFSDNWTVIYVIARSIGSDFQLFDAWNKFFNQTIRGFLAHGQGYGYRHAAFARGTVASTNQCIRSLIQISIWHNDHVVFGPAKTLHPLAMAASATIDIFRNRS